MALPRLVIQVWVRSSWCPLVRSSATGAGMRSRSTSVMVAGSSGRGACPTFPTSVMVCGSRRTRRRSKLVARCSLVAADPLVLFSTGVAGCSADDGGVVVGVARHVSSNPVGTSQLIT